MVLLRRERVLFLLDRQLRRICSAVVLMVVQEGERNAIDQRKIEYQLWEKHHVRVLRRTLAEVAQRAKLADPHEARLIMYAPCLPAGLSLCCHH